MVTGQNYTILQKTNNTNTNQTNRLSVQVTLYGLSFLILSSDNTCEFFIEKKFDKPRTPEELLEDLKVVFEKEPKLSQSFKQVNVVFGSPYYTLVPTTLFDKNK